MPSLRLGTTEDENAALASTSNQAKGEFWKSLILRR
jgi:hypothetical protein